MIIAVFFATFATALQGFATAFFHFATALPHDLALLPQHCHSTYISTIPYSRGLESNIYIFHRVFLKIVVVN
ncbi:hypothetical protein FA592_03600 [Sulfurospirillum diekertiae]|uniref:Uncharacterized protein n=1 Tax=Sulfurospirillum diekertiae TaxID=1854492 RepID=A0A6G9VPR6_9BACT|nr:hypothetical protein [Sulfurospirillum diekertiae]QIR75360.1 hypothetical protein FA584_03695 [Sulfurospirillum diekertiae]QIR78009.1 hypothetical protein FA592_03600 [Sulfurospirillum diekertiae]